MAKKKEQKAKRPVGRPEVKFEEEKQKLPEDWYNKILSEYEKGASDVEIKALIWKWRGSFSNDLWDRWLKDEDEFSETIRFGRILSHAWWMKQGRKNLENKDFSATLFYMNMKNRFGWKDRTETKVESKVEQVTTFKLPDNGRE